MCPDNDNDKASRKQKAIAELQRLVRDQRARLDPDVLAEVARIMTGNKTAAPAPNKHATNKPATSEPYDRAAATRAIELFLAEHKDKAGFKARLFSLIQKQSH